MSRLILGNCVDIMSGFPDRAVDFILTDPPYLVGFRDRSGRSIAGDRTDEWLQPACNQMYRVLKKDALLVSFYGWNRVDRFMAAWKKAGFSVVGHLVFTKNYSSKSAYVGYRHECAYVLAKGRPALPQNPLPDVLGWKYSGNRHHPTEKPVTSLQPLIESFTHTNAIVLDPFAGSASIRINRSNGAVSSVVTPYYSFMGCNGTMTLTPDRITDYKAPSAEEARAAKQAAKRPPIVNWPGEGFREMTKAEWSKTPADYKSVRGVAENDEHGAYRFRRIMTSGYMLDNVYITDMKTVEIPQK